MVDPAEPEPSDFGGFLAAVPRFRVQVLVQVSAEPAERTDSLSTNQSSLF